MVDFNSIHGMHNSAICVIISGSAFIYRNLPALVRGNINVLRLLNALLQSWRS